MNTSNNKTGVVARYLPHVIRVLLGLAFLVFGLNAFLNFIPPPEAPMPEGAMKFSVALMESGYMMELIGATQLLAGLALLANRFVPMALIALFAFMVNSVAFHIVLERTGLMMSLVFMALVLYLAWVHRAAYRPLLRPRHDP